MSDRAKRSGKIEFMRFVFSLFIVCFHINIDLWENKKSLGNFFSFFKEGQVGVEFFFLVSGYLMAMSAYKLRGSQNSISKNSIQFIYKKVIGFFPMHLIVFMIIYAVTIVGKHLSFTQSIATFVNALPNLFLIQRIGIYVKPLSSVEWYLAAMLVGMSVIFPFLLKKYNTFSRIVAPILGTLLIGIITQQTGKLSAGNEWMFGDTITKGQVRAIAELCLGVFSFEVVRYLRKLNLTKKGQMILTVIEVSAYFIALLYSVSQLSKRYQAYILFILLVAVALSFSEVTYGNHLFNNRIVYFLGKLSLPIYLCQDIARAFVKYMMVDFSNIIKVLVIFGGTIILAVPVLFLSEKLKAKIIKKVDRLRHVTSN